MLFGRCNARSYFRTVPWPVLWLRLLVALDNVRLDGRVARPSEETVTAEVHGIFVLRNALSVQAHLQRNAIKYNFVFCTCTEWGVGSAS